jgi:hypothetical protein
LRCPVHGIPDCSPLLNGCALVNALHESTATWVDIEQAISGVEDTYTPEGVAIWWESWLRQDPDNRLRRLRQAQGYGGMVAT